MFWFNFKSKLKEVEGIIAVGCFIAWKLRLRLRIGLDYAMPVSVGCHSYCSLGLS